ncbi:baseplate assembly protein [Brevibacillus fulvus]|uniref:Phage-related baseplate assembly protein n=1 Tax=Brevibacillus fulvus TaxID=1125967 RepID=A0A939BWX1_9BACL|nr:baseplate J/gp47 family protein [Brevibacillus fulvus]MBM7592246.1 phage-related baseplate assembly protein [Brevibacillus fulvus]
MSDLTSLPDIQFINVDAEKTTNEIITIYEALAERSLYPGDPIRLFLTALAQIIIQQRVLINQTALKNLLRYASGDILDHIGAFYKVPRLAAQASRTTVQFTLSTALSSVTLIPAGTRVGPAGANGLFYETVGPLEIKAGSLTGSVEAICTTAGVIGNDFLPGQINTLIDPIPFVQSVSNVNTTSGGAERESDDHYRERIYNAPESFSVAGPDGAYRFLAASAHPLIVDVSVDSPNPGVVKIVPLLEGGELPSQEILDSVLAKCSASDKRPLTDLVTVVEPNVRKYDISLTYWISVSRAAEAQTIQTTVKQAVENYILWQKSKLGRDVNPSELTRLVMQAGAHHVKVDSPEYTELQNDQVAVAESVSLTYGGLTNG